MAEIETREETITIQEEEQIPGILEIEPPQTRETGIELIQMEDTTEEVIEVPRMVDIGMIEEDLMEDSEEIIKQDIRTNRMENIIGEENKHQMER